MIYSIIAILNFKSRNKVTIVTSAKPEFYF